MSWTPPTVAEFKANFFRDFSYAPSTDPNNLNYITDTDIQNAINQGQGNFSCTLFGTQTTPIFMNLAAHTLVLNIRNSSMGLNSQARFPLNSSSVGSVSISNNINEVFANDPMFAQYLKTGYGQLYLEAIYPYTIGNVDINCGRTTFA